MAEKRTEVTAPAEQRVTRRETFPWTDRPFRLLERLNDEMDRVFEDFGVGRSWLGRRPGMGRPWSQRAAAEEWLPDIDMFQRENELVIRADLPGLSRDDIKVDVTEEAITIQGDRRRDYEEEREGVYRAERSYGSFRRVIPLPGGAMTDQAKARFKDGVLEVTIPAPPEAVARGRRLEIQETSENR